MSANHQMVSTELLEGLLSEAFAAGYAWHAHEIDAVSRPEYLRKVLAQLQEAHGHFAPSAVLEDGSPALLGRRT